FAPALLTVAIALPAAPDQHRAVGELLERQQAVGHAQYRAHDGADALRHDELVDQHLDRYLHAHPGQHVLDPHAARKHHTSGLQRLPLALPCVLHAVAAITGFD